MPVTRTNSALWTKLTRGSGLKDLHVMVGINDSKRTSSGASLADVARWNHWGTATIPSRPFLYVALNGEAQPVQEICKRVAKAVIEGKLEIEQAAQLLGIWGVKEVQRIIALSLEPPNRPATIARKGSDTTLVDTGQLRQNISYRIESAKPIPKGQ